MSGSRLEPARGALAGVRQDVQQKKDGKYDPRGTGAAWSHNFLNQKPWHPSNYRNQKRVWLAEQETQRQEKQNEIAKREYQQEQQNMLHNSYRCKEERDKYERMQAVAFMYMKPPGLEEALDKEHQNRKIDQERENKQANRIDNDSSTKSSNGDTKLQHWLISGIKATDNPPRGGLDPQAEENQLVFDTNDKQHEDNQEAQVSSSSKKKQKKLAKARQILKQAGYDLTKLPKIGKKKRSSMKNRTG